MLIDALVNHIRAVILAVTQGESFSKAFEAVIRGVGLWA